MYESYSRQALPDREYRELLGSSVCVFNSNNAFIIENILALDTDCENSWHKLIDLESGRLIKLIEETISKKNDSQIALLFRDIVSMRNRILHSFQITSEDGKQTLATKAKVKDGNRQFIITKEYLLHFISLNEKLSCALHEFRDSLVD